MLRLRPRLALALILLGGVALVVLALATAPAQPRAPAASSLGGSVPLAPGMDPDLQLRQRLLHFVLGAAFTGMLAIPMGRVVPAGALPFMLAGAATGLAVITETIQRAAGASGPAAEGALAVAFGGAMVAGAVLLRWFLQPRAEGGPSDSPP